MNFEERMVIQKKNGKNVGKWIRERGLKMRSEYNKNPKLCWQCNKPISFRARLKSDFCSKECVSKFYTFDIPGVTEEVVDKIVCWSRRCKRCSTKMYYTKHTNAVRLEREGGLCRSCSKINPSPETTRKRVKSFRETRSQIRKQKLGEKKKATMVQGNIDLPTNIEKTL